MFFRYCFFLFAALWVAGCVCGRRPERPAHVAPVLLISLDAFRWDYCEKYPAETPNLRRLRREGASAQALIPGFPSNTFANHYSIVTGLRPSHHGIVNNRFFDPTNGRFFHYNQPASARDGRWWGGEPVWVTAVRQGRASACSFWPGSEAEIAGMRPTFWKPFDYSVPFQTRLDELFGWLKLPARERPAVITFYFEETNTVGHNAGPDSPELAAAIKLIDGRIGELLERAKNENIALNLVVVSDHGMTGTGRERAIKLDDYLDLTTVQIDFDGPVMGLRPLAGDVEGLLQKLSKLPPQAHVFRKENLPAHLHVDDNPRYPPVWILPDPGWHVVSTSWFNSKKDKYMKGEHGYDPAQRDMHGILIVHGPAFQKDGRVIAAAENIHIYNLLCAAARLQPARNDGDDRLVHGLMR
ncbi:MAG: alkaline phosphatase family protein [Nibricoccus sp.]